MKTHSIVPAHNGLSTYSPLDYSRRKNRMAGKRPESTLQHLRTLLGFTSSPQPDSIKFRPPILISIPTPSSKTKTSLPFTLTILDLLDIPHLSPKNILSTHTFTTELPRCSMRNSDSTIPQNGDLEFIFITEKHFSLSDLLPDKRDVVHISTGTASDLHPTLTLIDSLGLPSKSKVVGIFDVHELARDVAALKSSFSPSIAKLLHRLQSPEIGANATEFVLRTALLLVLESCKHEMRDEIGNVWVQCLKEVGIGKRIEKGSLEAVRNGVKMVGNLVFKGVRRSKEEIERVRKERAWKREVGGPVEVVDEVRLWDGMWEVVD
jgi:hypothetical protein